MKRLAFAALLLLVGCNGTYTVVMPYCPVSDSAKAKVDSVPVGCLFGDSSKVKR